MDGILTHFCVASSWITGHKSCTELAEDSIQLDDSHNYTHLTPNTQS